MDNSNDIRPASQIPPVECPNDFITIKISKSKLKKCLKISLLILFLLSMWVNFTSVHSSIRATRARSRSMRIEMPARVEKPPRIEFNHGGMERRYHSGSDRVFDSYEIYYEDDWDQDVFIPEHYPMPPR